MKVIVAFVDFGTAGSKLAGVFYEQSRALTALAAYPFAGQYQLRTYQLNAPSPYRVESFTRTPDAFINQETGERHLINQAQS